MILVFRLAVVAVLYLFLLAAIRVLRRDLGAAAEASPGTAEPARLEVINPARAALPPGRVFALRRATSIGREPDNDVVVDEDTVSGRHVRLAPRDGRWWVEDLGSTNGTWVNDRQVAGRHPLKSGDVIQIGRVSLRFAS